MDAIEFAKTMRKICRSHTSCVECEFVKVQGHCGITNPEADHAGMVAVAEQWAREHVERWAKARPAETGAGTAETGAGEKTAEMERQIGMLRGKTQMLAEESAMQTNTINVLQEMMEKARKEIRLVDAFSQRFMEIACDERERMEKRLTERIEKLERGAKKDENRE